MLNTLIHTLFTCFILIFFRPFLIPAIIPMMSMTLKVIRIIRHFVLMKESFFIILLSCFVIFLDSSFPLY